MVWPLVFMSIHSLSVPFASTASLTYVIDCHPRDANQAFVTINFTKAVFTFIATTYANGIMAKVGPRAVFDGITLINLGICMLTIPAYVYGKRFRSLVSLFFYFCVLVGIGFSLTVWNRLLEVLLERKSPVRGEMTWMRSGSAMWEAIHKTRMECGIFMRLRTHGSYMHSFFSYNRWFCSMLWCLPCCEEVLMGAQYYRIEEVPVIYMLQLVHQPHVG